MSGAWCMSPFIKFWKLIVFLDYYWTQCCKAHKKGILKLKSVYSCVCNISLIHCSWHFEIKSLSPCSHVLFCTIDKMKQCFWSHFLLFFILLFMSLTLYYLIKFCPCLVLSLFWESTFEEQLPVEKKSEGSSIKACILQDYTIRKIKGKLVL